MERGGRAFGRHRQEGPRRFAAAEAAAVAAEDRLAFLAAFGIVAGIGGHAPEGGREDGEEDAGSVLRGGHDAVIAAAADARVQDEGDRADDEVAEGGGVAGLGLEVVERNARVEAGNGGVNGVGRDEEDRAHLAGGRAFGGIEFGELALFRGLGIADHSRGEVDGDVLRFFEREVEGAFGAAFADRIGFAVEGAAHGQLVGMAAGLGVGGRGGALGGEFEVLEAEGRRGGVDPVGRGGGGGVGGAAAGDGDGVGEDGPCRQARFDRDVDDHVQRFAGLDLREREVAFGIDALHGGGRAEGRAGVLYAGK